MFNGADEPVGNYKVRGRYDGVPPVSSWGEASSVVKWVLQQVGTFPEVVTVCSVEDIPPSQLVGYRPGVVLQALIDGALEVSPEDDTWTLSHSQVRKFKAVWNEVRDALSLLGAWPRIPVTMALVFDGSAVAPLWGERILQLRPAGDDAS